LNQSIDYLHGKNIHDFEIEVPKFSHDLYFCCKALDETFSDDINFRADKVIKGECQVLNLIKDGKSIYAVEFIPTPEGYKINKIESSRNKDSIEENLKRQIKEELSKLIKNK